MWQGKRVFLTFPTSFLGSWTALSLQQLGAQVFGFCPEAPTSSPNLFDLSNLAQNISMTYGDLRDQESLRQALNFAQADVVLHLGESGLLKGAQENPLDTISKSVMGTATLMELLRETASVRSVVVVSSDKVYAANSGNEAHSESDKVSAERGIFPAAKLCSEWVALAYRSSFFNPEKYNKHKVAVATARLEAGIGGGDFSSTSLIPQVMESLCHRKSLDLRNPQSVRPWIHVFDQVRGILLLAEALYVKGPKLGPTYNLGAQEFTSVAEVVQELSLALGLDVPRIEPSTAPSVHGLLESSLAKRDFHWEPLWHLERTLRDVASWYQMHYEGYPMDKKILSGLIEYLNHSKV